MIKRKVGFSMKGGEKIVERRISTEEDFMSYKVDDLLFGCMILLATYNEKEKKLYLPKAKYIDRTSKQFIRKVTEDTPRTNARHLAMLEERGLVSEDETNYYFPYEEGKRYQLIDYDMLKYLVDTGSTFIIQIYTYLHMKNAFKENYEFTKKELFTSALGYSIKSSMYQTIDNCLDCLVKQGILSYHLTYNDKIINGKTVTVPVMVMDSLIIKGAQLKKNGMCQNVW